jgi:hypothetical protein
MEAEKIKAILLAAACFLMACLNLWNEFKDWFDKKYQPRKGQGKSENKVPPTKESVPDIVGKTKFRLPENYPPKKQEAPVKEEVPPIKEAEAITQAEPEPPKEKDPLKKEIAELKELVLKQAKMMEEAKPFLSVPMEREKLPDNAPVDLEKETVSVVTEKERAPFGTGTSLDEFELVVRTLKGKPISKDEETQVVKIIPQIEGTDIYRQFTRQIQGAEERAMEILNQMEDDRQPVSDNGIDGANNFDFGKYVRE